MIRGEIALLAGVGFLLFGIFMGGQTQYTATEHAFGIGLYDLRGVVADCEKPLPRTEKCVVIVEVKPESASKEM